jgi:DNA-binding MarR family transcriptional regulator
MTEVKEERPDHILALLGYVLEAFRRDLADSLPERAGLRSSQLRLLSLTPRDGMRVTDLAERVGMTKQALGEFANDLEQRGLLESVRDPADKRVRILRPTQRGRQAVSAGELVIGDLETRLRDRLGRRKWDQLRTLLRETAALSS